MDFEYERPSSGRVTVEGIERFIQLRDDGKPAIIFAAHLANWELLAVIAAKFDLKVAALSDRRATSTFATTSSAGGTS